jgi:carbohydrate-selective porin OprB
VRRGARPDASTTAKAVHAATPIGAPFRGGFKNTSRFGLAFAPWCRTRDGPRFQRLSRSDTFPISVLVSLRIRDGREVMFEAAYLAQFGAPVAVQPDVQVVIHPSTIRTSQVRSPSAFNSN